MVCRTLQLAILTIVAGEFYVHLKQSAVLLHSQRRKRSNDIIDFTSRIVTFNHDHIRNYTIRKWGFTVDR